MPSCGTGRRRGPRRHALSGYRVRNLHWLRAEPSPASGRLVGGVEGTVEAVGRDHFRCRETDSEKVYRERNAPDENRQCWENPDRLSNRMFHLPPSGCEL